jgi:hypothetical protein
MSDNFFDKNDIVEEDSFFDQEDLVEDSFASKNLQAPMGAGEAALTGFQQGSTLGLSPILAGAGAVGSELLEDAADIAGLTTDSDLKDQGFEVEDDYQGLDGLMQAYYDMRNQQKAQEEKAFEDQPLATLAGNLPGGIATTMATGGIGSTGKVGNILSKILPQTEKLKKAKLASKVGMGVKEGTKAGALSGFGQGDAKLIEDPSEVLEETASTAIGGGLLGGVLPAVGSGLKKGKDFLMQSPLAKNVGLGYKAGKKGIDIADDDQVVDYITNITKDIRESISKNFKGSSKKQLLEQADEIGIRVNAGEAIDDVIEDIQKTGGFGKREQQELMGFVEDLKSLSNKANFDDIVEGEVPLKSYNLDDLKLSETDEILQKIGPRAYPMGQEDSTVRYARDVYSKLRQLSNDAMESSTLPEKNKRLKSLFDGLESLGIKPKEFFSNQETMKDQVEKKIQQKLTASPLSSSDSDMRNFLKYLGRADEELSETISEKSKFASDLSKFVKQSEGEGSVSLKAAAGPVQKILAKGGNVGGNVVKSSKDAAKDVSKMVYDKMLKMTPEGAVDFSKDLIQQFGNKAQPYANQLIKAAESGDQRRTALMYGIYQQPAFRKMLERIGREALDEQDGEE